MKVSIVVFLVTGINITGTLAKFAGQGQRCSVILRGIAKVKGLPERSIVLHVWQQSRNQQGKVLENSEMLGPIARSATIPVYAMNFLTVFSQSADSIAGSGVVGGVINTAEASGTRVAEIVLRIANGARANDIPIEPAPTVPMFDWRELRRWGIDESQIPARSVVRFKQPTLWEQYKWHITGAISLFILEALLIVGLLINRVRRREAEKNTERFAQQAEAERRHLDEVVSNVPGISWEARTEQGTNEWKATFVSEYVEHMLGYSVEEWMSTPGFALTIIPEEDREQTALEAQVLFESGKEGVIQFRWNAKDGRIVWVESHIAPILDQTGKPVGLRGVTMDISDRKVAEESLRESEERLQQAISVARFGVFEHDHLTGILRVSPLTREIHAWGEQDTPTLEGLLAQVHPEDREMFIAAVERAHDPAGDGFFAREFRIVVAGGKVRWVSARSRTLFEGGNGDRRPVRTIGAELDITEHKEAEAALIVSESRFRTMADAAPLLIWMCGPDKLCTYVNQGWLEFTGRTIEEELGSGWTEGIFIEDRKRCWEVFDSAFDRREPFRMEYRLRRSDGIFCWVYDSGTPRFSSDGEFLGYIGSCIDIVDRKEAEEALQNAHEEVSKLKNQLQEENIYLQEEIKLAHNVDEIIGRSNAIKYVLFKIEQVSKTNATVMILGETGTGKELVARAIHSQSQRKDRPLVKVNCAALSAGLIESELFGHEKGSFTGASARKIGRFELADGATLFLDEIGELPLDLQSKLLRILQEGEFERLGSSRTVKVDVRIIAATNRNVKAEVEKGAFREDLWYRLNVFPITLPPLSQRKEDIPPMVEHFVSSFSRKIGKDITAVSSATLKKLQDYSWPGNVRELANVIERGVINAQGPVLHITDQFEQATPSQPTGTSKTLDELEKEYITRILGDTAWKIEGPNGAARILGLNPSTLRTRMVKLGIQKSAHSSAKG